MNKPQTNHPVNTITAHDKAGDTQHSIKHHPEFDSTVCLSSSTVRSSLSSHANTNKFTENNSSHAQSHTPPQVHANDSNKIISLQFRISATKTPDKDTVKKVIALVTELLITKVGIIITLKQKDEVIVKDRQYYEYRKSIYDEHDTKAEQLEKESEDEQFHNDNTEKSQELFELNEYVGTELKPFLTSAKSTVEHHIKERECEFRICNFRQKRCKDLEVDIKELLEPYIKISQRQKLPCQL